MPIMMIKIPTGNILECGERGTEEIMGGGMCVHIQHCMQARPMQHCVYCILYPDLNYTLCVLHSVSRSELHTVATGADTESQDCITETDRQLPSSLIRYATGGETFLLPHRSRLPPGQEQEPSILDAWPKMDVAAASFLRLGAPQGRHVLTGQRYQIPPSEAQLVKGTRPQAHLVALLNKRIETELRRNGISRDACSQRKLLTRLQVSEPVLAMQTYMYDLLLSQ